MFKPKGYPLFQMELHIPFFAFREYPSPTEDVGGSPQREWTDLSFLNPNSRAKCGICKAQFSLVICGSNYRRWAGYVFLKGDFDGDKDFLEEVHEDPIALDGQLDTNITAVDVHIPIWDPREHFLMMFKSRISHVLKEWEALVRMLQYCIEQNVCCGLFLYRNNFRNKSKHANKLPGSLRLFCFNTGL
jgi:hypothetical protein